MYQRADSSNSWGRNLSFLRSVPEDAHSGTVSLNNQLLGRAILARNVRIDKMFESLKGFDLFNQNTGYAGMRIARQLWSDEGGSVSPFAAVLMVTILVVGIIPGVATLRDHIVQKFGDMAVSLESLDQSYSFTVNGVTSEYVDSNTLEDNAGEAPAGLDLTIPAVAGE